MVTIQELKALARDTIRSGSVAVGTSAVLLSPNMVDTAVRKTLVITNTSTAGQIIYLGFGQEAQAGTGIPLISAGSSWTESIDSSYVPSSWDIWAVSSGANGSVAIHERILK